MGKDIKTVLLLDLYGKMLTDRQYDVMDLYYNQDLSLAEIAEHANITRQGVRDLIVRSEQFLYELEDKLKFFDKYGYIDDNVEKINELLLQLSQYNRERLLSTFVDEKIYDISLILDNFKRG